MQFPLQKSHAHRVCKDVRIYFDLRNDPLIYYRLSGTPDKKTNIEKKLIFIVFTPLKLFQTDYYAFNVNDILQSPSVYKIIISRFEVNIMGFF